MLIKFLKKTFLRKLFIIRRYSGGINKNLNVSAKNLLNTNIDEKTYYGILKSLIFVNGVRKTSKLNRTLCYIEELINSKKLSFENSIKVIDVGGSVGLDAISNYKILSNHFRVNQYVLADLYTHLYYDKNKNVIFDHDGNILQIITDKYFVNVNFEFRYTIEYCFNMFNILKTKRILKKYNDVKFIKEDCEEIPLIIPEIKENRIFSVDQIDVFKGLNSEYDFVICMNLLQPRYFSQEKINLGFDNLVKSVKPNGFLLIGTEGSYNLFFKNESGYKEVAAFNGDSVVI